MSDEERLEDYAEGIGEAIMNAVQVLESEKPSRFSDEYQLIRLMNFLITDRSEAFSEICDRLAEETLREYKIVASEALYDASREDCGPLAKSLGRIPWPACKTGMEG